MRKFGFRGFAAVLALTFISHIAESGAEWTEITGHLGASEDITCIGGIPGTDTIYAGSTAGVYVSNDLGKTWKREDVSSFGPKVTGIAFWTGKIFVSSDEGLYIKEGTEDLWRHSEGERNLKGVCAYGDTGEIVTWTRDRIFTVNGDSWRDITPGAVQGEIVKVTAGSSLLYIASGGEVIFGKPGTDGWDRVTLVGDKGEEVPEDMENITEDENEDEEAVLLESIRDMTPLYPDGVCASTGKGIYLMEGASLGPKKVDTTGLPSESVVTALAVNEGILAATGKKVFFRGSEALFWKSVLEVSDGGNIREIKTCKSNNGPEIILAAFSKRVFLFAYKQGSFSDIRGPGELSVFGERFSGGPDIKEVHKMAIDYAEVSPGKIESWRKAAKWRAILPRLSLGYDEDHSDNIEIYTSATQKYLVTGPREKRDGWDVSLTWDLPDLIWTSAQTSIDVRSKLMVQLRDDILEDVTRLYFERKRLIEEIYLRREKDKEVRDPAKESRVEELTAYIDAYTGGKFSAAMDSRSEM